MTYGSVNHDFGDWKWEVIFETTIVKVSNIHTNTDMTILVFYRHVFEIHIGYLTSWMKLFWICLLISASNCEISLGRK